MKKNKRREQMVWYVFLLPTIIGFFLFMLYPVLESFRLSFFKSNGTLESWVGFKNYIYVVKNAGFWQAVSNTFYIAFFVLLISLTAVQLTK